MIFDLCFVLVDLGDPWYKKAASEMIRSARRAYKDHDMRVVQLTDSKTDHCPEADGVFTLATEVGKEQMCQAKGHLIAEYALKAERPVIFCDVDLLWHNDGLLDKMREAVHCLWRANMPSMPFNTGIITTYPGEREFWLRYRSACENLPAEVCGWWGDQFAMTAAAYRENRVVPLIMDEIAPAIDELPEKAPPLPGIPVVTPAVHFKGNRKHLMLPYARMLDGGKGFDFARPGNAIQWGDWKPDAAPTSVREGWAF